MIQQPRLYEIVVEKILNEHVLKMKPDEQLPTESEFAKIFGVSVPTVREALRSLVQSGYIRRRQGSGTYRSEFKKSDELAQKVDRTVAIVTPLDLSLSNLSFYFSKLALLTAKNLQSLGLKSEIYFGESIPSQPRAFDESALHRDIKAGKIALAVVMSEAETESRGYTRLLRAAGIPIIEADRIFSPNGQDRTMDMLHRALSVLTRNNRRKVACIGFNGHDSAKVRDLVAAEGCVTDEAWMLSDLHPSEAGSGYSLMREVWTTSKIKPDGLIITDDLFFRDVSLAIQELGIKVPEQLLVITAKNSGVTLNAEFSPIEIEYDASEVASQIVQNVQIILNGGQASELVCEPKLIEAGSADSLESEAVANR